MKKLIFFAFLLPFLSSCEDRGTVTIFYILNNSGHNVTLTVFNAEIQSLGIIKDTAYIIQDGGEIKNMVSMRGDNDYSLFPFGGRADSARILFDGTTVLSYRRGSSNPRNLLNTENYSGGKKSKGLYEFTYTIREEDYNMAD